MELQKPNKFSEKYITIWKKHSKGRATGSTQDSYLHTKKLVREIRDCYIPEKQLQKEPSSFSPEKQRLREIK